MRELLLLLLLSLSSSSGQEAASEVDPEVAVAFNPDVYDGYQRRFTVEVGPKTEECYFLDNVQAGHKINFHFMVKILATKYSLKRGNHRCVAVVVSRS